MKAITNKLVELRTLSSASAKSTFEHNRRGSLAADEQVQAVPTNVHLPQSQTTLRIGLADTFEKGTVISVPADEIALDLRAIAAEHSLVIWSMVASACLTLALMHLLMWLKRRQPLTSIIALTAQVFDRQGKFAMGYRVIREHMTQLAEVTVTR